MIRLLLLLLLMPSLASATGVGRTGAIGEVGGPVASGGGTCNVEDTQGGSGGTILKVAGGAGQEYIGSEFIAGDWEDITKVELCVAESLSNDIDNLTYTIKLYNNASGKPGTFISGATCTFPGTAAPTWGTGNECGSSTDKNWVGCTFSSAIGLTNSTSYHIVIGAGGSYDTLNNLSVERDTTGSYDLNKTAGPENTDCPAAGLPCCTGAGTGTCEWTAIDFSNELMARFSSGATCTGN